MAKKRAAKAKARKFLVLISTCGEYGQAVNDGNDYASIADAKEHMSDILEWHRNEMGDSAKAAWIVEIVAVGTTPSGMVWDK